MGDPTGTVVPSFDHPSDGTCAGGRFVRYVDCCAGFGAIGPGFRGAVMLPSDPVWGSIVPPMPMVSAGFVGPRRDGRMLPVRGFMGPRLPKPMICDGSVTGARVIVLS